MLTDSCYTIIYLFSDCFTDLVKYNSVLIVAYKVTIQAFTNTSISHLMNSEHLLKHQMMQVNGKL